MSTSTAVPLPEFLVTELKLTKIVTAINGGYDLSEGIDEMGNHWRFLTNTNPSSLPHYFTAIKLAGLETHFAMGKPVDGFNEEEGYTIPADPSMVGVYYNGDDENLQKYHAMYRHVEEQLRPYLSKVNRLWL